MRGYVANTDYDWYEFLGSREPAVDEVNFWQPSGLRRFRAVAPGSPFFFRLKSPHNAIGGFGFFARNVPRVPAWYAWTHSASRTERRRSARWSHGLPATAGPLRLATARN